MCYLVDHAIVNYYSWKSVGFSIFYFVWVIPHRCYPLRLIFASRKASSQFFPVMLYWLSCFLVCRGFLDGLVRNSNPIQKLTKKLGVFVPCKEDFHARFRPFGTYATLFLTSLGPSRSIFGFTVGVIIQLLEIGIIIIMNGLI